MYRWLWYHWLICLYIYNTFIVNIIYIYNTLIVNIINLSMLLLVIVHALEVSRLSFTYSFTIYLAVSKNLTHLVLWGVTLYSFRSLVFITYPCDIITSLVNYLLIIRMYAIIRSHIWTSLSVFRTKFPPISFPSESCDFTLDPKAVLRIYA